MLTELWGFLSANVSELSLGAMALMGWRIVVFFRKDKYVLPFLNEGKNKLESIFGAGNVAAFISEAKALKVSEIKPAILNYAERFLRIEKMLELLLANGIDLGVYDDNPDRKEEIENLL